MKALRKLLTRSREQSEMPAISPDESGYTTRSLRRRSGVEQASPALRSNASNGKFPSDTAQQTTPSVREPSLSPVISTRSLRSAARNSVTSPVQLRNSVSSQGDANSRSNKSIKSFDSVEQEMQPPAKSTRLSMKQQPSPDQPEQSSVTTRRSSLRQPTVKAEVTADEPSSEPVKSLRSSSRRKSTVESSQAKPEDSRKESESKAERPTSRRSNRRPSGADLDSVEAENGLESPTASRSLRSALKVKVPGPRKIKARKEGNLLIISGIKDFPEEQNPSLRIKLKTSFRSDADSTGGSGRKRRRGQNDDPDIKAEEDFSPRKKMKEAATIADNARASRRSGRQTRLTEDAQDQGPNDADGNTEMPDSSDKRNEQDSRARRAARRSAVTEAIKKPNTAEDEDAASSSDLTQLNDDDDASAIKDDDEAARNQRSVTPASSIPPDEITEEMLPPPFLDFPANPLPESAYSAKAAFLHARRFEPLPDLKRFLGPLSSHSPSRRSTETLLKLAYNTQRVLEAWQDEYILLDEKTCQVGHSQPKKPAKGGRSPLSQWKWQENLEKDLFGDGSILAYLAKSRQEAEGDVPAKRAARKQRRGEVDMLAGVTNAAPAAGRLSMVNGNPDEDGDGGRAQRARRQPKRFEEVMAEAEPSRRRKRGAAALEDNARSSAPPAVATSSKRAKRGTQNKAAISTETDEEEGDGVVKPQWNNPPQRPMSSVSQVGKQPVPPATKAKTTGPAQIAPPTQTAAPQGQPQPPPQPSTAAPTPTAQPPPVPMAYPAYGYYTRDPGHAWRYPHIYSAHGVHPQAYQHPPGYAATAYYPHMYPMHYPPPPPHLAHAAPQPHPHPQQHPHAHAPPHAQQPRHPTHPLATSVTASSQSHQTQPSTAAPAASGKPTTTTNTPGKSPKGQPPRRRKPALGPNGQPHEKSQTRSASMTLWWAERKKKLAAQKEAAEAAAAAERTAGGGVGPVGGAAGDELGGVAKTGAGVEGGGEKMDVGDGAGNRGRSGAAGAPPLSSRPSSSGGLSMLERLSADAARAADARAADPANARETVGQYSRPGSVGGRPASSGPSPLGSGGLSMLERLGLKPGGAGGESGTPK